uniref:Large terminase n=1 Tax=Siphoviridae sp. ctBeL15 TaxID=2825374 RepID=A0A8S5UZZ0_9CAUD|nr:MAG TPA: large terminase [Siphoviridae sp. ctBeL15]
MLRAYARYTDVAITGTRGMTKTYTKMISEMINGVAWTGTQVLYTGPSLKQLASIGGKTFHDIEHDYAALAKHWRVTAESKDDFKIETDYGSAFYIGEKRGDNIHAATAEEFAQEENPPFDFDEYTTIVLPAVRLRHNVNGSPDPNFVAYKNHSITSAGRKQNHAYQVRCEVMKEMGRGESAFTMDVPWQCVVLQQMRPYSWAQKLRTKLTPEKWMREMESRYTGADSNPIVRDEVLTECRKLMIAENRHCAYDVGNKLKPEDVIYIVGYDVSYADDKKNAKCACVVLKCTRQTDWLKRDRYLKQVVYVDVWNPPVKSMMQAQRIKDVWSRFCCDGGAATYLAIDAWQYGTSVVENLMMDLGDGLSPLCVRNHASFTELEQENAVPCLYPIKAGGAGVTDPDAEMVRYAELQFENRNVELLCSNVNEGVENYKKYHRIKDDSMDAMLADPYIKTRELVGQIQNLKKVASGTTQKEERISKHIQRDIWSALKYALRVAQILEKEELAKAVRHANDWDAVLAKYKNRAAAPHRAAAAGAGGRTVTARRGGRIC